MRVSDDILRFVVFIGTCVNGNFTPLGTGFLIYKKDHGEVFQHLVTARHVIEGISLDEIFVRINLTSGVTGLVPFKKSDWRFHQSSFERQFIDVAVAPCNMPADSVAVTNISLEDSMLTPETIQDEDIGIGDEVHVVGLYTNHFGQDKNIPIVRIGNIASMPTDEPFQTQHGYINGYLIEAHSLGGSSGSPVFVGLPPSRAIEGKIKLSKQAWYLLGLMCGHWTAENPEDAVAENANDRGTARINTGISIVIPVQHIFEVINGPELTAEREKIMKEHRAKIAKNFSFDSAKPPTSPDANSSLTGDQIFSNMLNRPPKPRTGEKK